MATIIEHKKYVCTDAINNNNKFWEYFKYDDGTVAVKYGRVGKTATEDPPKKMTDRELEKVIAGKVNGRGKEGTPSYKPPYREIAIVAEAAQVAPTGPSLTKTVLKEAAHTQLAGGNTALMNLVERLVEANKHELYKATGGQMDIDLTTGIISTPVGVVTKDTVKQARDVLNALDPLVQRKDFDSTSFIQNLNSYLMLVPQAVGHSRGWHRSFFTSQNTLIRQSTLLDQLDASADLASARLEAAKNSAVKSSLATTPNIFDAQLEILTDKDIIKMIEKKFAETVNSKHETRYMKPIRFYRVTMPNQEAAFNTNLQLWPSTKNKNVWLLWHGTRMFNVLSILKKGLFCPPKSGSFHVTGRMFGDGVYGSDQSTKSLNYAYGYWDGGSRDKNCFMFMADFAMGNYYTPRSSHEALPKRDFDSTYAKAGVSGVLNNEMIVYSDNQVNIKYLVEFEEKR
jgi:poly [ADP-ribose] polymerase